MHPISLCVPPTWQMFAVRVLSMRFNVDHSTTFSGENKGRERQPRRAKRKLNEKYKPKEVVEEEETYNSLYIYARIISVRTCVPLKSTYDLLHPRYQACPCSFLLNGLFQKQKQQEQLNVDAGGAGRRYVRLRASRFASTTVPW